jgi:adenine C2-methylase RlmN of 23S rRNA A2503 and tRNA A37
VTVRDTLGRDVKGACGQLGYEKIMKERIEEMDEMESKEE